MPAQRAVRRGLIRGVFSSIVASVLRHISTCTEAAPGVRYSQDTLTLSLISSNWGSVGEWRMWYFVTQNQTSPVLSTLNTAHWNADFALAICLTCRGCTIMFICVLSCRMSYTYFKLTEWWSIQMIQWWLQDNEDISTAVIIYDTWHDHNLWGNKYN